MPISKPTMLLLLLSWTTVGFASDAETPRVVSTIIAATVGGEPIYVGEVNSGLDALLGGVKKRTAGKLPARVRAEMLEQLIRQRIVLAHVTKRHPKLAAGRLEVDAAVKEIEVRFAKQQIDLNTRLADREIPRDALRRELAWRLTWKSYLANRVADDVLIRYFEAHRADFDGTKKHVRHILLSFKTSDGEAPVAQRDLMEKAKALRAEIVAKSLSFEDASRDHSQSPLAASGGDLGEITREGEMPEAFSAAAFALASDEISPPVATPFGVHLIECLAVKPGEKTLADCRDEVRLAVLKQGFTRLVDRARPKTAVEYTGAMPYLSPDDDGALVLP